MKTKIKPLHDRVLIQRLEEEETTPGGVIIPDTAREKPARGEVLAVGPGRMKEDGKVEPLSVKVGDKVIFSKYAGTEIKYSGAEVTILREDDILAIFDE